MNHLAEYLRFKSEKRGGVEPPLFKLEEDQTVRVEELLMVFKKTHEYRASFLRKILKIMGKPENR